MSALEEALTLGWLGGAAVAAEGGGVDLVTATAAVRNLESRDLFTREQYDALRQDARRAAFTVARLARVDSLERVRSALVKDVREGGTLDEFREGVADLLLPAHHLETVYRTNVAAAYSQGLMDVLSQPLAGDEFPYLEYHATHDSRTRPEHLQMEKLGIQGTNVYRRDDPLWQVFLPPWDYNCRCALVPLSLEDAAARGIMEAQRWLESGRRPISPAWVDRPAFMPAQGFLDSVERIGGV